MIVFRGGKRKGVWRLPLRGTVGLLASLTEPASGLGPSGNDPCRLQAARAPLRAPLTRSSPGVVTAQVAGPIHGMAASNQFSGDVLPIHKTRRNHPVIACRVRSAVTDRTTPDATARNRPTVDQSAEIGAGFPVTALATFGRIHAAEANYAIAYAKRVAVGDLRHDAGERLAAYRCRHTGRGDAATALNAGPDALSHIGATDNGGQQQNRTDAEPLRARAPGRPPRSAPSTRSPSRSSPTGTWASGTSWTARSRPCGRAPCCS